MAHIQGPFLKTKFPTEIAGEGEGMVEGCRSEKEVTNQMQWLCKLIKNSQTTVNNPLANK